MITFPKNEQINVAVIYTREATKEGKWYFTFNCKGCGNPIYALEDNSNGQIALRELQNQTYRIPCVGCSHDDIYHSSEAKSLMAAESLVGFRPSRVSISNSPRKPLLPQYKNANPIMGVGLIEDRPKAAAIVGRIITAWADIEVQCARLLAKLMGTNVPAAAAVFGALRSSRTQADALDAAAKVVLNEKDHRLFLAHLSRKASLEKERNDLAHGCYGIEVSMPDAIIWASQIDYIAFTTAHEVGTSQAALEQYRKKMFVYELGILERIAQEISELHLQLAFFIGYMDWPEGKGRSLRYLELGRQPHIRAIMLRNSTTTKK